MAAGADFRALANEIPSCVTHGMGYNDPKLNTTVNGAYTSSPAICQQTCRDTVFCMYFTWYNDSKGCWLQGNTSELTIVNSSVYSGPANCSDTTTTMPPTTTSYENTTNVSVAAPDIVKEQPTVSNLEHNTGAEFPWYGWAGIALAIVAILLLLFCCCFGQKKGGNSKPRAAKVSVDKANPDEEVPGPPIDMQPLMGTEMQLEAQMVPQYSYSMPPAPAPVPMTYSVAAPVATYPVAVPATTYSATAQMATYSVAAPYPVTAPAPATSMTYSAAVPTMRFSDFVAGGPETNCPQCGNVYVADSLFCRMCGNKRNLGSIAEPSVSVAQPMAY